MHFNPSITKAVLALSIGLLCLTSCSKESSEFVEISNLETTSNFGEVLMGDWSVVLSQTNQNAANISFDKNHQGRTDRKDLLGVTQNGDQYVDFTWDMPAENVIILQYNGSENMSKTYRVLEATDDNLTLHDGHKAIPFRKMELVAF